MGSVFVNYSLAMLTGMIHPSGTTAGPASTSQSHILVLDVVEEGPLAETGGRFTTLPEDTPVESRMTSSRRILYSAGFGVNSGTGRNRVTTMRSLGPLSPLHKHS